MNYPSTALIKEAFLSIAESEQRLYDIKQTLIELHYKSEEVDNSAWLLENLKNNVAPSDDAGEVLFLRHQRAQADLTEAFQSQSVSRIEQELGQAIEFITEAGKTLHKR
jgi:hypothetical protein